MKERTFDPLTGQFDISNRQINNLSATAEPTITDDDGSGYSKGSLWINTDANQAYICVDSSSGSAVWVGLNGVDGLSVLTGATDPDDGIGKNGDTYLQTADGTTYSKGDWFIKATGLWGAPVSNLVGVSGVDGADGADGSDGADGAAWFTGSTDPTVTPPAGPPTPKNNDFYLQASGSVWQLLTGVWTDTTTNLQGARGSMWYIGTADPTVEPHPGIDGDFYLRNGSRVWELISGTWTDTGYDIKGDIGAAGSDGADGSRWYVSDGTNPNSDTLSPLSPSPSEGDLCVDQVGAVWQLGVSVWVVTGQNLTGPAGASGSGSGDVNKPVVTTENAGMVAVLANADGSLLESAGVLVGNFSKINVAETRTAPIDMDGNLLQRPELKNWIETATVTPTSMGTIVLNMALGNVFKTTLTGNVTTLTINNPPADTKSGTVTWIVTQDTSARSIALPTGGVWNGGNPPDFSTPGAVYVITYRTTNAGANWVVFAGGGSVFGLTEGQIVFAGVDGKVAQDAGLFWDNTNKRMGIKTNTPVNILDVNLEAGVEVDVTSSATTIQTTCFGGTGGIESMRNGTLTTETNAETYIGYPDQYVGYGFASALYFSKIRFYSLERSGDLTSSRIRYFKIRGYTGSAWEDVPITAWVEGCSQYESTQAEATNTNGWKTVEIQPSPYTMIVVYAISGWAAWWSLSEIEVFKVPGNTNILDCTDTGLVGIATESPESRLHINNTDDNLSLKVLRSGTTATDSIADFTSNVGGSGTVVAKIMVDGDLENTNGVYGSISDIKLKENIIPATPKLGDLLQVNVCNYNFKNLPDLKQLGVIAQELELIFPCLIKNTPDTKTIKDPDWVAGPGQTEKNRPWIVVDLGTTTKSVKYSVFIPMLIKAIQEINEKHESLRSQTEALEVRIAAIENG